MGNNGTDTYVGVWARLRHRQHLQSLPPQPAQRISLGLRLHNRTDSCHTNSRHLAHFTLMCGPVGCFSTAHTTLTRGAVATSHQLSSHRRGDTGQACRHGGVPLFIIPHHPPVLQRLTRVGGDGSQGRRAARREAQSGRMQHTHSQTGSTDGVRNVTHHKPICASPSTTPLHRWNTTQAQRLYGRRLPTCTPACKRTPRRTRGCPTPPDGWGAEAAESRAALAAQVASSPEGSLDNSTAVRHRQQGHSHHAQRTGGGMKSRPTTAPPPPFLDTGATSTAGALLIFPSSQLPDKTTPCMPCCKTQLLGETDMPHSRHTHRPQSPRRHWCR
jgi:hypothetical protein